MLLVVPPQLEATVRAIGQPFVVSAEPPRDELSALRERFARVSGHEAAVLGNRELFGRLWTAALLPTAERACREWRPQLVLHEAAEHASAIAAERCGVAHAQVAISLAEVEAGSLDLAAPAWPSTRAHRRTLARVAQPDALPRLAGSVALPRNLAVPRQAAAHLARRGGSDAPLVYVSFGSIAGGLPNAAAVYRTALDAVAGLRRARPAHRRPELDIDTSGRVPENARVEAWVPQADALADATLVVAHGGSGTTFGTLAAGVPLVIVPLFADQLVNAERAAAAGAAVVVEPDRDAERGMGSLGPQHVPRLRAAIETVLADPSYARSARRIAEEMAALPSIDDLLASLTR